MQTGLVGCLCSRSFFAELYLLKARERLRCTLGVQYLFIERKGKFFVAEIINEQTHDTNITVFLNLSFARSHYTTEIRDIKTKG